MKFDHNFNLINKTKSSRIYECDNTLARLDFIDKTAIRVALYKKGAQMLPTFTISPDNNLSHTGRDKLSSNGFKMYEPIEDEKDGKEIFKLENGIEISLDLHNFLLSYYKNGKRIFADRAPLAYNIDDEFGQGAYHYISRFDDEEIFGLDRKSVV